MLEGPVFGERLACSAETAKAALVIAELGSRHSEQVSKKRLQIFC